MSPIFILAQEPLKEPQAFSPTLSFGISGGVNFSDAEFGTSFSNQPFKTKLWLRNNFGVSARYIVEKNLGLIVEINYVQQGWEQDFSDPDASTSFQEFLKSLSYKHSMNYLQIPFLTHIYAGNKKFKLVINLGPEVSILLNEKETINKELSDYLSSGDLRPNVTTDQYYKRVDNKFQYGLTGGIGFEFQTNIGSIVIEGRYTYGLSDFFNNSKTDPFQKSANRNIVIKSTLLFKIF